MIEIGYYFLLLSFFFSFFQWLLPSLDIITEKRKFSEFAPTSAILQLIFVTLSFFILEYAFIISDFSVEVVYKNSHSTKPFLYKITGLWGNHEGSALLWILILSVFGGLLYFFSKKKNSNLINTALAVQGFLCFSFLAFIIFTSNPFERLYPPPFNGIGLNPVLQDPALAFHPPFLYLGYVGFSTVFSITIAGLIHKKIDREWANIIKPWIIIAWVFLTIGISLGSWWAYYELGWGGWWFWDPVENVSLLPWLSGTALLHSILVLQKRNDLKQWVIFLSLVTYLLSLLGTFLVRSGILTSVHSFALDPERGLIILFIIFITAFGGFILYGLQLNKIKDPEKKQPFYLLSKESLLIANNLFFLCAAAIILLGTVYPLILQALDLGKISVGPPYYNSTVIPLMLPAIFLSGIAPTIAWKQDNIKSIFKKTYFSIFLSIVAFIILFVFFDIKSILGLIGFGFSFWIIFNTTVDWGKKIKLFKNTPKTTWQKLKSYPRHSYGMTVAHWGFAICLLGITASTLFQKELITYSPKDETILLGDFAFTLKKKDRQLKTNYLAETATIEIYKQNKFVTYLYPEKRFYPIKKITTTEAAIYSNGIQDIYITIGDFDSDKGYVMNIYINPLNPFLWIGAFIMALGGTLCIKNRNDKVKTDEKSN